MGMVTQRNIGAQIQVKRSGNVATATAGGSGDATSVTGDTIDRVALGLPLSAVFAVMFSATLGSGQTLSVTSAVQDSADSSAWADFVTEAATVVATGPSGGGTVTGCHEVFVELTGARQYVRHNFLPDLNRASTDTATVSAAIVLAGANELPTAQPVA